MTFYFYDLETSGFNPRTARIMQFAGQRTDMELKPVGEPDNLLVKMTPDVLPDPDAVLVTGITPQQTLTDGVTEAEFIKYLEGQVFLPDTIIVGFNNIRFDDEFMRFTLWRNFSDAYEWQWKDNCSRWDLLDLTRMTRALRPEGIKWPFAPDGKPTVKLELLSAANKLTHDNAHDALSDVRAAVGVARLIKSKQPKLYDYLFNLRDKAKVKVLVETGNPLVYSSGRYPAEYEKTTVAAAAASLPEGRGSLMYDLRADPTGFTSLTAAELASRWSDYTKDAPYFPVKLLAYNKCPAVAPLSVMDSGSFKRLQINQQEIDSNLAKLRSSKDFGNKLLKAFEIKQGGRQKQLTADPQGVDAMLYDGFVDGADKSLMAAVRAASDEELSLENFKFKDERLRLLLPLYKARNYPKSLKDDEQKAWEDFRLKRLISGGDTSRVSKYFQRLSELSDRPELTKEHRYLLEELNLYGQSILAAD